MSAARFPEQPRLPSVPVGPRGDAAGEFDLAHNVPGQAARWRARQERDAQPVRSLLARVLGVHTDERAWRIGADGEEMVGRVLHRLVAHEDPRWRVLHSVPVGSRGSDIDHLVIGPGGVFSLNTKNHPGARIWAGGNTFLVNQFRQPYLRNSRHEADRASRLLSRACRFRVAVRGMVVPVNASHVSVKALVGVHVVDHRELAHWLRRRVDVLAADEVAAIYAAARRSTTWQPHR